MSNAQIACTRCDPPGVVWRFAHGENPHNPQHGQSYTCADCNGTGVMPADYEPETLELMYAENTAQDGDE
jgi:hypothetical protein